MEWQKIKKEEKMKKAKSLACGKKRKRGKSNEGDKGQGEHVQARGKAENPQRGHMGREKQDVADSKREN